MHEKIMIISFLVFKLLKRIIRKELENNTKIHTADNFHT